MDGNGRWAQSQGLPRTEGHKAGEHSLFEVVDAAIDAGVQWLTVYAFSTENWKRPKDEVRFLINFNQEILLRR
ncbi:MAG: undecaprenyl diphosphate synthase family protein, partial [Acidimicrobiales bacterium]